MLYFNENDVYPDLEEAVKTCPQHVTKISAYACDSVKEWEEAIEEGWNPYEYFKHERDYIKGRDF